MLHWHIPLIALAALAGWLLGARRRSPSEAIDDELDAIDYSLQIERFAIERGAKLANEFIDHEYRRTLKAMDEQKKRKAEALRSNPGKRVRFLRRVSDRLGSK